MKKRFLKVRRNAIIISIALILLSTFYGVNRSLGAKYREVSDGFNIGVYSKRDGYRLQSIRSQLKVRTDASMNTLTISDKYTEADTQTNALRSARNKLADLLEKGGSPSELYRANRELETAYNAVLEKLYLIGTSNTDEENIRHDSSRMSGAASVIEKSRYNESIHEFRRNVLSAFPTNALREICFVAEPELYE